MDLSTFTNVITPALFKMPSSSRSKICNLNQTCHSCYTFTFLGRCIEKFGPIGHAILMYFLSALLIYVPIGILCHFHLFKALNITDGVFQGLPKYVWAIIIEYSSASILYIIFAWIYYKVKHIELFLSFITSFLYRISTTGRLSSKVDACQPLKWTHS